MAAPSDVLFVVADQSKVWVEADVYEKDLAKVRKGQSLCFEGDSMGCGGGKRYLGFTQEMRQNFEYFLS